MADLLNSEKGPFQMIFGDNASANPNIVFPLVLAAFAVLIFIAFRILSKDKGRSDMTDEELEKDRAKHDKRMQKQAALDGKDYVPERARATEAEEIAEAKRRSGKK